MSVAQAQTRVLLSTLARFAIGILLFGTVAAGLAIYSQRTSLLGTSARAPAPATLVAKPASPSIVDPAQRSPVTAADSQGSLPFPLPTDYGVYALNDAKLSELNLLQEQVPDKRIAMSTPINQPSRTTLPTEKRDLWCSAAISGLRARSMRFVWSPAWCAPDLRCQGKRASRLGRLNIRNLSYEFRVRPISGNPEMLMVQAENPDFVLPAGRYVLALKNQGYDFTVAGKVTDPSQCLERTDAANGTFYSDCQKQ